MGKKYASITANLADTKRPTVVGADRHPGWHALRKIAARITTPLLPDDYLHLRRMMEQEPDSGQGSLQPKKPPPGGPPPWR